MPMLALSCAEPGDERLAARFGAAGIAARTPATCASSASLSVAAGRLKRITWSIMMPLARPWCRSATVDSACAHECTAPRSFWNAIAPIIELISMSERAARSLAVRAPRSAARARRCARLRARCRRTAGGRRATGSDSTLCVSASMPVAAVIERRQVERELGIGEHRLGEQQRREDDLLDVRVVVGDHRRAADLASRCPRWSAARRSTAAPARSAAPAGGPTRTRGCRPGARPSARSPSRRRAPRRRRSRSRVGAMRLVRRRAGHHLLAHRVAGDRRR